MRTFFVMLPVLALLVFAASSPVFAGNADPLFINLTSDDSHRSLMAISFGQAQMQRGHPLTLYLNDKGVLLANKKNAQFAEQQKLLSDVLAKGGVILVCPFCSKKFGVEESDLIAGAKTSNPDLTGAALFQDGTQTLSW